MISQDRFLVRNKKHLLWMFNLEYQEDYMIKNVTKIAKRESSGRLLFRFPFKRQRKVEMQTDVPPLSLSNKVLER